MLYTVSMRDLILNYMDQNWHPGWELELNCDQLDLPIMADSQLFEVFVSAVRIQCQQIHAPDHTNIEN